MYCMKQKAFTLLEVLSVMVVMAIIVGLSVPALKQVFVTKAVDSAAVMLRSKLSATSVEALRKNCPVGLFIPSRTNEDDGYYAYASCSMCYLYNDSSKWTFTERVNLEKTDAYDQTSPQWETFPKGAVIYPGKIFASDSSNGFIWSKEEISNNIYSLSSSVFVNNKNSSNKSVSAVTVDGIRGHIIAFLPNGRAACVSNQTELVPAKFAIRIVNAVLDVDDTNFTGFRNLDDYVELLVDQTGGQIRVISPDDEGYGEQAE